MDWIGVDLDGTLAEWCEPYDVLRIGAPIPAMVARVQAWLAAGEEVRIFTARVGPASAKECLAALGDLCRDGDAQAQWLRYQTILIEAWCVEHLGRALPITATKDFHMRELWDDRCVQVVTNTGQEAWRAAAR